MLSQAMRLLALLRLIVILLLLVGCSSLDRPYMSSFEPFTDNGGQTTFRFRAHTASIPYPEDSKEGEAVRKTWLEKYLSLNNLCQNGYEIIERKVVMRAETFAGPARTIYYTGRCIDNPVLK
jgi:hypothetical protein